MTDLEEVNYKTLPKFEYRPSIDGLRAFAALIVVCFHASTPGFQNGFAGVDIFFVLSGYLITSIIARELDGTHTLDPVLFYARRIKRLLPASFFVMLITTVAYKSVANPLLVRYKRNSFMAGVFYYANWNMLWDNDDYFAVEDVSPVQHYWSLSIEEQFYFIWPLFMWYLVKLVKFNVRSMVLIVVLFILTAASFLLCLYVYQTDLMLSYVGSFERSYQLTLGALLAFVSIHIDFKQYKTFGMPLSLLSSLVFLVSLGTGWITSTAIVGAISSAITIILLISLEMDQESFFSQWILSNVISQKIGQLSYGIYLWHWPIIVLGDLMEILPQDHLIRTPLILISSIILSLISFHGIEFPIKTLDTKKKNGTVIAIGIITTIVLGLSVFSLLQVSQVVEDIYQETRKDDKFVSVSIVEPEIEKGKILLAGDSEVAQLSSGFTSLAETLGFYFRSLGQARCSWFYDGIYFFHNTDMTEICGEVVETITDIIMEDEIDIVFLTTHVSESHLTLNKYRYGTDEWFEQVREGTEKLLDKWTKFTHVVILLPFKSPVRNIPNCIASKVEGEEKNCDYKSDHKTQQRKVKELWKDIAPKYDDVTLVDLENFYCPEGLCKAMSDEGILTWIDMIHPSNEYCEEKAEEFNTLLEDYCIFLETGKAKCA